MTVSGNKQGQYYNFESGVGGSPLKLIEEQQGLASFKDTIKWASDWLGDNPLVVERRGAASKADDLVK